MTTILSCSSVYLREGAQACHQSRILVLGVFVLVVSLVNVYCDNGTR